MLPCVFGRFLARTGWHEECDQRITVPTKGSDFVGAPVRFSTFVRGWGDSPAEGGVCTFLDGQ